MVNFKNILANRRKELKLTKEILHKINVSIKLLVSGKPGASYRSNYY